MNSVFQGRSLLAEKDFTRAELEYLVDFQYSLKRIEEKRDSTSLFRRKKYRSFI